MLRLDRSRRHTPALLLTVTALALALGGCSELATRGVAPPPDGQHTAAAHAAGIVRTGHGWTPDGGIQGTIPAAGSCHYRRLPDGEILPDARCTPGAVDVAVSSDNAQATICRRGGYSDSVRPPEEITQPVKYKMLAAYGIPASQAHDYELDHLVPESLGGSSSIENLWPEPNHDAGRYQRSEYVANDKDEIEQRSWRAVCDGDLALDQAQHAMATDWTRLQ